MNEFKKWIVFLPQLPAVPSTLRVMVWRKMREAGALGLQNGVWVLPDTNDSVALIEDLDLYLRGHEASSIYLRTISNDEIVHSLLRQRILSDRAEEYAEFCERCQALQTELKKESAADKFTFAELEETEEELQKLTAWLQKIIKRDFIGSSSREQALQELDECRQAHAAFSQIVYRQHGLSQPSSDPSGDMNG